MRVVQGVFMTPFTTDKLLKCERAIKGEPSIPAYYHYEDYVGAQQQKKRSILRGDKRR